MSEAVRAASWLVCATVARDAAPSGPPVLHWKVPLATNQFEIEAWIGAPSVGGVTRDALLVIEHEDGLTLGVTDECTPTADTPPVDGDGGAVRRYSGAAELMMEHQVVARAHSWHALRWAGSRHRRSIASPDRGSSGRSC